MTTLIALFWCFENEFKKSCVLCRNFISIYLSGSRAESISHSFASLTRERYFQHSKIKFVSSRGHVISSISKSSFTATLEQQRSDKVCVSRALLSASEVSQLSSEFFGWNSRYVQVDESQYKPLLVIIKEVLFLLLLCVKSLLCEDFSMSNVHFPWPDELTIMSW